MDRILKLSSMTTPKASFNTRSIKTMAETAKRELAIYLAAVQERVEGWWYLIDTCTHVNQEPPPLPRMLLSLLDFDTNASYVCFLPVSALWIAFCDRADQKECNRASGGVAIVLCLV
mmetsp:Transcript_23111/g.35018  ORF Transcript_23111/g.35018 Transcript_23111/m.35018 type:complete len:117 (+) Transcript_23111:222-572(+)